MSPGHIAPLRAVLADRPVTWGIASVLGGSLLIAAGSWLSTPMYPVPMTMQTLAVLVVAGIAGARLAAASVITWLALAALGLPLLADGTGGLEPFSGPTVGYLAGMVVATFVCGWLTEKPTMRGWITMTLVFLAGHALILAMGWLRLAFLVGPQAAWDSGVVPFFAGMVLKSVLAVAVVKLAEPRVRRAAAVDLDR